MEEISSNFFLIIFLLAFTIFLLIGFIKLPSNKHSNIKYTPNNYPKLFIYLVLKNNWVSTSFTRE